MRTGVTMDELTILIEERAISRLLYDYSYALDMNRPDELAALFVEDCRVSYAPNFGAEGMQAYKKTLEGIGTFFRATSHHNSNICVDFIGDTQAKVRSIVLAIHRYTKDRPDGILYGQYFDLVVKAAGKWKFKSRELRTTLANNYHVKAGNETGRTG